MSTRSGKRIHGSLHENMVEASSELAVKSERKTRSRRLKENEGVIVIKSKKRSNYVSFPIDDEAVDITTKIPLNGDTQTLKEQDLNVSAKTSEADRGKVVRPTRRTKKISVNSNEVPEAPVVENGKSKKNRKNKKKKDTVEMEVNGNENEIAIVVQKKSKKRKGKKVNSHTQHEIASTANHMNKSNGSVDSFHSAAGSPVKTTNSDEVVQANNSFGKSPRRVSKRLKPDSCENIESACLTETQDCSSKKRKLSTFENNLEGNNRSLLSRCNKSVNKSQDLESSSDTPAVLNGTFEKEPHSRRKSSIKNSTFDKSDTPLKVTSKLNSTYEKNTPTPIKLNKNKKEEKVEEMLLTSSISDKPIEEQVFNSTLDKSKTCETVNLNGTYEKTKNSRQSILNSTFDKLNETKQSTLNSTYEKSNEKHITLNSTYDKIKDSTFEKTKESETINSTFEKSNRSRRSLNTTFDNTNESKNSPLNSTLDKTKQSKLNSTFEKSKDSTFDQETKLNSTFEKAENNCGSPKSSLISSDSASNVTLDKSDDNSRISITSDDSRTENIVNTTPVLIESSMDESQTLEQTPTETENENDKPCITPLKREGTFTKDGPEVLVSPQPKVTTNVTPLKRMSLPSPGSTPFPFSKSSQKEKCKLNVTRSIEKATRRSSLAEPVLRTTKVMFCSPVNDPVVVMQQKKKVIKSSLKGSNKSFIFDESVSEVVCPAGRKRSYTQNDADDARCKRSRLDTQRQAVTRLSRPRTCSAIVKPSEPPTPSKTPAKSSPPPRPARTKLPDFAALHQRRFDRMESLDQCQLRRARRARQLLTPSGAAGIIEKSSPKTKVTIDPVKSVKETLKKTDTPTKTPKLPTLMSLRPGYTRFGFKMDVGVNPFSVPPKPQPKPKENKLNTILTRQPSQPSLHGATASRREAAKQAVMREKSFTSLSDKRNLTRTENRSVIKGVRTNRRFELQMKMRNVNS